MPKRPSPNQRSTHRFAVALPITMEGRPGATHDLSATGVLFESSVAPEIGAKVNLSLEYLAQGRDCNLTFQGEVVRVERHGDNFNVAVHMEAPLFPEY